jgi:hypothetical protein
MVNTIKWTRLRTAVEWSRLRMRPYRESRMDALKQYVGGHYNQDAQAERHPVNLLEVAVQVYRRQLAARRPGVTISAKRREFKPMAATLEAAVNDVLREIDAESAFQGAVFDAIFSLGVVKVGLTESALADANGWKNDPGIPFIDVVDIDDLVLDMTARKWDAQLFVGNRYVLPYEEAMDSRLFKNKDIKPSILSPYNEQGDRKAWSLGSTTAWSDEALANDMVEMWDVWLPIDGLMLTFCADETGGIKGDPVRVVEWAGPEEGPYHCLAFQPISNNLMPVPPIANLRDLGDLVNRVFRKLGRQAERQKTVTLVGSGADEDGTRIMQANDGDVLRVDRPEATREAKFGGIDQPSLAFGIQIRDLFSYLAGNLDAMGGLSTMAPTLGQEELLKASSSQKIQDMQASMLRFARSVCKSVAWYVWTDPVRDYQVTKPIDGTDIEVPVVFRPSDRDPESKFLELELDIRPTSMQDASNTQRLQTVTQTFTQYLAPLAPIMAQQGMMLDVQAFVRQVAELTNTPEINDLVKVAPAPQEPQGAPEQQGMPDRTTREYIRRSVPNGGTREARDNVLSQVLAGGGATPQQGAMLSRPQNA